MFSLGALEVLESDALTVRRWFTERGGVAVWEAPHRRWITPLYSPDWEVHGRPSPDVASEPVRQIFDPAEVLVVVPQEAARLPGEADLPLVRDVLAAAGPEAWLASCGAPNGPEWVICVPATKIPLTEWNFSPAPTSK